MGHNSKLMNNNRNIEMEPTYIYKDKIEQVQSLRREKKFLTKVGYIPPLLNRETVKQ